MKALVKELLKHFKKVNDETTETHSNDCSQENIDYIRRSVVAEPKHKMTYSGFSWKTL